MAEMCIRCAGGFHALALEMDEKFFFFFYRNNYNMLLIPHLEPFSPRSPTWLRSCIAGVRAMNCHYFEPFGHDTLDLFTLF